MEVRRSDLSHKKFLTLFYYYLIFNKDHVQTHIGEKPFKCNQCDLLFITLFLLKDHERTHTREKPLKFK